MSEDAITGDAGYLGYIGGWAPVVALAGPLERGEDDAVRDLLREAHRAGLVTSFDWPTWMTGRGRELSGDPEAIGLATLEECRRLLVAHLRRDRFVVGHLRDMIANGEVPAILRRAAAITEAKAAQVAAAKADGTAVAFPTTGDPTPANGAAPAAAAPTAPAAAPTAAAPSIGDR